MTEAAEEAKLRRLLRKHGHRLEKTPSRHWTRYYGVGYQVVDDRNTVVLGCSSREYEATLAQVQEWAAEKFGGAK